MPGTVMSSEQAVRYQKDGPVAVLTMVHEPHNLLGPALLEALFAALDRAVAEGQRAAIIRSGLRNFCAGADIRLFERRSDDRSQRAKALPVSPAETVRRLEGYPIPLVTSVHGMCLGGGFELALATDYVSAARSARIGSAEATLGMHPLMGAVQRVTQRAGALRAKEMAMLARRYDPDTLCRWGLINLVVDDDSLEPSTSAVAHELANGPTVAHAATKALVAVAVNEGVLAADDAMVEIQKPIWSSRDLAEGLRSFRTQGPGLARFEGR